MALKLRLIGIIEGVNSLFERASYYSISVGAGLLAALVAYSFNKLARHRGKVADVFAVPLIEEALKTASALFLGGSIPLAHLVFGFVEGSFELGRIKRGKVTALLAVLSHTIFGMTTVAARSVSGSIIAGVAAASLVHMVWNAYVYDLVRT